MSTDCSSRCCTVIIYTHTHTHTAAVCHVVHGTADNGPLYLAKSSIDYECAYNNIVTTSPRHLRFVHRGFDNGTVHVTVQLKHLVVEMPRLQSLSLCTYHPSHNCSICTMNRLCIRMSLWQNTHQQ